MDKEKEADKLWKKAGKYCMPNVFDFRMKPDWEAACPLFEKAALLWKVHCARVWCTVSMRQ
jgi:gamma-soluble NSF attachment protein